MFHAQPQPSSDPAEREPKDDEHYEYQDDDAQREGKLPIEANASYRQTEENMPKELSGSRSGREFC